MVDFWTLIYFVVVVVSPVSRVPCGRPTLCALLWEGTFKCEACANVFCGSEKNTLWGNRRSLFPFLLLLLILQFSEVLYECHFPQILGARANMYPQQDTPSKGHQEAWLFSLNYKYLVLKFSLMFISRLPWGLRPIGCCHKIYFVR